MGFLTQLRDVVFQTLLEAGYNPLKASGSNLRASIKGYDYILGPDSLEEFRYRGVATARLVATENRRCVVLTYGKTEDELNVKVSNFVRLVPEMEKRIGSPIVLVIDPFYEPETKMFGAEIQVRISRVYNPF